ncbi:MAG: class A beta-lactamase-related serine hydrolase [OM182 bacterium]|nr:MAG: class A beta-lactamase-related serine hydrolase [OM182 bacterium]
MEHKLTDEQAARVQQFDLNVEKVEALLQRAGKEVDDGLLPAAQLAIAREGEVVLQQSYGSAQDDSLICVFSATKAITSAAAWLLFQQGELAEEERVADIVPEFATKDKGHITVGQLFSHTAGFPHAPFAPLDWDDKDKRYARFAKWWLNWDPGSRFEYHASSSMWIIAEIIERRSGETYRDFVRSQVIEPLQLQDLYVGLPTPQNPRALPCVYVGEAMTPQEYKDLGMRVPPETEVTESAILSFNTPEVRAVGVPGGGAFATASAMTLFYQALLHGGNSHASPWSMQTLLDARRVRSGDFTDLLFKKPANRALGLIISGDKSRNFRGFGKTNSPEAFGHNGAGGQLVWADPATGISFTYLTPGHDRNSVRQGSRGVAISSLAAVCAND